MRPQKTILEEAERLKKIKPYVKEKSLFGDNNRKAISFQISVLEMELDEDDIDSRSEDEDWSPFEKDAAFQAFYWASGESPDRPSKEWAELADMPKEPKKESKKKK